MVEIKAGSLNDIERYLDQLNYNSIFSYYITNIYPSKTDRDIYLATFKRKGIFKLLVDILW